MRSGLSYARTAALLVGAAAVVAVLGFLLQLPSLSPRKLLHIERIVASGQFWLLELLGAAITSFVITGVPVVLFRRLILWIGALSVAMQAAWMTVTLDFASRSAEPLGIVVGAALAVLFARAFLPAKYEANP